MDINTPAHSQLGKASPYVDQYDAGLLFPIARQASRDSLGLTEDRALPFFGADFWTGYELSWLNTRGKPQVGVAHFTVPCESRNLIESKSFKLYLNSFNNTRFESVQEVQACMRQDLSEAAWRGSTTTGSVGVEIRLPEAFERESMRALSGLSVDRLDVECSTYHPEPALLRAEQDEAPVTETLTSDLLRSNCPVTGQPDWGSVQIQYSGPQIDQAGLLQYIVSFRNHNDFHEQCVERMFNDLWQRCKPVKLSVYARYTRRGGLDINPWRTSHPQAMPSLARTPRQ